jgi:periplasmic copper chaperone A
MKKLILACAIVASLATAAKAQNVGDIAIVNVVVPPSLVPSATSASVYLSMTNNGNEADKLISVTTPIATMAMLHETKIENDIASMMHLDSLDIPPKADVEMKPGGLHVMLTGLQSPLKEGDVVTFELQFEKAGNVKFDVIVTKPKT